MSKSNPPALRARERIEQGLARLCADNKVTLTHVIAVATQMDARNTEPDTEHPHSNGAGGGR